MFREISDSTPEIRKSWTHSQWFDAVSCCFSLLEQKDCPAFSAEEWKELIIDNPICIQYCPIPFEVKSLLTPAELAVWDSRDICDALAYEGDFLADLLDLSKIEQSDFEDVFGLPEDFPTLEEYLDVTSGYFPDKKIPPHLQTAITSR